MKSSMSNNTDTASPVSTNDQQSLQLETVEMAAELPHLDDR